MNNNIKLVIVIRKDLKMRRGKEIAQGSHASMSWLSRLVQTALTTGAFDLTEVQAEWLMGSFAKVVVQVSSEADLMAVHTAALDAGVESHVITDAGRTEFNGVATVTACGIGPDEADKIDKITGALTLY
jgi:PTH2 family peptidyl-tRNA hydrolase